ncbi:hypothetical protein PC9H_007741 [Pleurotus ostreatus]|uniref:Uncharacterized protein n=1 Tax=Pleurotus ostreatus TaxID=5322 RepID=A0A8H6ZYQ2_PLEOS|nr:uncharacterized protein PC9H_007741 [Pleurotus ostreatus]KAF7428517.1 hypothetical protein PC9H_007741 [Pleurotus ostreatus]
MPYPLTKLPTSPDDITAMDPRHALKLGMAFTKNGLLQALNNLYNLAPAVEASRSAFVPFLDYASMTFSILLLHLEGRTPITDLPSSLLTSAQGDDLFFSTPNNGQGKTLQAILGANCNPTMSAVVRSIKKAQVLIEQWRKTPEDYTAAALRSAIDFGPHMLELMQAQIASIDTKRLEGSLTAEEVKTMVAENVGWFETQVGVEALLPFVVSHHDAGASKFWPPIHPDGMALIPQLIEDNAARWQFAPVHPVTREASPWAV